MRIQPLKFTAVSSILNWAGNNLGAVGKRLGDAWYVQKDGLYYYFGAYPMEHSFEYRLVMVSEKDLGD